MTFRRWWQPRPMGRNARVRALLAADRDLISLSPPQGYLDNTRVAKGTPHDSHRTPLDASALASHLLGPVVLVAVPASACPHEVFAPGIGMPIPPRVERWLCDEAGPA